MEERCDRCSWSLDMDTDSNDEHKKMLTCVAYDMDVFVDYKCDYFRLMDDKQDV